MKCGHEMCGCEVSAGQEYCSDTCRTGQMTEGKCACGHDACTSMAM